MTHDEALQLLSARLDGPLAADQQQALDAWLAESPDHQVLAEAFQAQHGELRTAFEPRRQAAQETAAAVARQLVQPPTPAAGSAPRWWRLLVMPLPAACAAALLIGLGLVLYRGKHEQPIPVRPVASTTSTDAAEDNGLKPKTKPEAPKTVALKAGEKFETKAGEKRRVTLPDGSFLYLNQKTTVELPENRHVKLVAGEVFLEAVPARTEAERFVVETPKRSVTALGTKFAVSASEAGTGVLVTQGKVEVSGLGQKVTTGQELLAGADKVAPAPRASAALDWTRDLMIAAESPLVPAGKHSGGSLVAVDPYGQEAKLSLVKYHVDVHIEDGFARTTIDQTYFNAENSRMEGTFYFPLPPDGSLSRLAMYVDGDLMEGGMAERGHARDVYERIRYQNRDPALLEWVDGSVFKMRVFPLEARQEKRIVLSYTQRLPVLYGHATYRFPAGHTLAVVDQWSFHALVKNGAQMSASSPSHPTMKLTPQGADLELTDKANNVKVDRDVVLELHDHLAPAQGEVARWSSGELDGQKYLMVRYRPDLPSAPRRERRDWVFLFESSGARDPLVARAQVEVIRALLTHAEHEDTFTVLSVGTRVRKWADAPQPASPANVESAVKWLENRHLIGALNLDQALTDAVPLLTAGSNPHLVHVGGGIASIGEQRADELVKRIPEGIRYVGIAVGKRFSPAFMKVAAERRGGLFAQVNPDEPIGWRGFEIASTLNAPRLLNVRVDAPGADAPRFLTFSNVLAHGEELAAVANVTHIVPNNHVVPTAVTIRGTLDGQPFERVLPVENVAPNAGYLPRTWAKLEIDRLLAEDSGGNQKAVTDLSKAMYVMTPFTSLLVLENEQMYKDFNVDRGRKDHWAMYPCPPKIPVVYIPDPNQPAGSRPDLKGQKPHANVVLQTIMVRNSPTFLTWPGHNAGDTPVMTAGQRFGGGFVLNESDEDEELTNEDLGFDGTLATTLKENKELSDNIAVDFALRTGAKRFFSRNDIAHFKEGRGTGRLSLVDGERRERLADGRKLRESLMAGDAAPTRRRPPALRTTFGTSPAFDQPLGETRLSLELFDGVSAGVSGRWGDLSEAGLPVDALGDGGRIRSNHWQFGFGLDGGDRVDLYMRGLGRKAGNLGRPMGQRLPELAEAAPVWGRQTEKRLGAMSRDRARQLAITAALSDRLPVQRNANLFRQVEELSQRVDELEGEHQSDGKLVKEFDGLGLLAAGVSAPAYYGRPSYSGNHRGFTDLAAYAPGLSSSRADIRAVLEAEAAPRFGSRRGAIDPAARKLIDEARAGGWKVLTIPTGDDTKPLQFKHDARGRYAYTRQVSLGLKEEVLCDGTHLWHLYGEIGLGAKRPVSRFHRAELLDLVPDFVPPADDLAYGSDVKLVNQNTVALVPLRPTNADFEPAGWLEVRMVFADRRLAERQWVLCVKGQPDDVLIREVYEPEVTKLVVTDKDHKEKSIDEAKRDDKPATEPDLAPDMNRLVVLPLPLRSREHVYRELDMEPGWDLFQDRNACFEYLDEDSLMRLLACEFAANNGQNVARIWDTCFAPKQDNRTGFFTLMSAANYNPRALERLTAQFEADAENPLVRYLWQMHDENIHAWQARLGFAPRAGDPDTFLGRLTGFRRIVARWQGGYLHHELWGQRDGERGRVIAFARANADNVLGWCTLAMVQDHCPTPAAWRAVADAWAVLADKSGLRYPALYEQARCLGNAGENEAAQARYQELFKKALAEGVLPPLDASFRSVLQGGKEDQWARLMRETAEKAARPVIVTLAWQCYQLGDTALSDTLLDQALTQPPAADSKPIDRTIDKALTGIAAVHFLNATSRYDRADQIVRDLLADEKLSKSAGLWRLASRTADNRKDSVRAVACLERALDVEYAHLPELFDVQPVRNDYGRLLGHYEWLADSAAALKVDPPKDLAARVVKAADRWRHLDPESTDVPNRAATILRKAGGAGAADLAWDYVTTPLALKPTESGPWVSLAWSLRQEGNWRLADKCYEMAFKADPTNAQLLWDRAEHLRRQGQEAEGRALLRQLADKDWQPRFNGLKAQARQAIEGR